MRFIDYCDQNRILLAVYPPHSTHTLQPLDVCLFGPLATAYSDELASFIYKSMAFTALKKRDFFRLFNKAWETSFTKENILSGFEACGLEPFNPERVLARFSTTTTSRPSSSEGSKSALTAQEWRRIEELFRSVVSDIYNQQAKQLSNTIHSLSMKVMTLEMENQGYIKSLANAKKKRKPSKALLLKPPERYHGGAVFYSPRKVQQARDRQAEKDAATELVRQQKDEETRRKEAEKHEKARIAEERKHMRAAAKEAQARKAEEKRLQKEKEQLAKEANHQLQNNIRTSRKPRKPIQPAARRLEQVVDEQSIVEVVEPLCERNRRGRPIKLPVRFRD
jgi:hypothetical protein